MKINALCENISILKENNKNNIEKFQLKIKKLEKELSFKEDNLELLQKYFIKINILNEENAKLEI